jgi:hypothetical protein
VVLSGREADLARFLAVDEIDASLGVWDLTRETARYPLLDRLIMIHGHWGLVRFRLSTLSFWTSFTLITHLGLRFW